MHSWCDVYVILAASFKISVWIIHILRCFLSGMRAGTKKGKKCHAVMSTAWLEMGSQPVVRVSPGQKQRPSVFLLSFLCSGCSVRDGSIQATWLWCREQLSHTLQQGLKKRLQTQQRLRKNQPQPSIYCHNQCNCKNSQLRCHICWPSTDCNIKIFCCGKLGNTEIGKGMDFSPAWPGCPAALLPMPHKWAHRCHGPHICPNYFTPQLVSITVTADRKELK